MIAIFARPYNARMFVERESDVGFKGQAGAFEDNFGNKLFAHAGSCLGNKVTVTFESDCHLLRHYATAQTKISLRAI
jgi:hypothetical protein